MVDIRFLDVIQSSKDPHNFVEDIPKGFFVPFRSLPLEVSKSSKERIRRDKAVVNQIG